MKDGEEEEEEVKVEVKQEEEDKFNWDSASMMPDVIATRAKVIILKYFLSYLSIVFTLSLSMYVRWSSAFLNMYGH